jgi:glycine oxidase
VAKSLRDTWDYIIVGQGMAGSILDYELTKRGYRVLVVDQGHETAASRVAAGIVNPITGKNFVLSWRFEDFIEVAKTTYAALSDLLGFEVMKSQNILRSLDDIAQENHWAARSGDPITQKYVVDTPDLSTWRNVLKSPPVIAEITHSYRVDTAQFITRYRAYLSDQGRLLTAIFDVDTLTINSTSVNYIGHEANSLIFCTGAFDIPRFASPSLKSTKGQALIIHCPGLSADKMYKQKHFIVPLGNNHYWMGGGYLWNAVDTDPTPEFKSEMLEFLTVNFDLPPFEIVSHLAAIRPTTTDRRPKIGTFDGYSHIHYMNGLGTKGASMAPLVAQEMAEYLSKR